jgi:hypothetical protein
MTARVIAIAITNSSTENPVSALVIKRDSLLSISD